MGSSEYSASSSAARKTPLEVSRLSISNSKSSLCSGRRTFSVKLDTTNKMFVIVTGVTLSRQEEDEVPG